MSQLCRERRLIAVIKQVRDVEQRLAFVAEHRHDFRMRVAERVDGQAAEKIQIPSACVVEEVTTLPAYGEYRQAVVGWNQDAFLEFGNFLKVHTLL